ncbi:autotransporter-associated beta strand repeat-containing protein [Caulobacter sp. 73W]|uniref:Autotransporter-associated beta strand repeat-containing protein n=1 Tax=Caulobacter sp. 73W TaxID=3161137 RepID=A0AB39KS68_9CAUL
MTNANPLGPGSLASTAIEAGRDEQDDIILFSLPSGSRLEWATGWVDYGLTLNGSGAPNLSITLPAAIVGVTLAFEALHLDGPLHLSGKMVELRPGVTLDGPVTSELDVLALTFSGATDADFDIRRGGLWISAASALTMSGDISGAGTFYVSSEATLSGRNSLTGRTSVEGVLRLTGGEAIADGAAIDLVANGRLIIEDAETIGALNGGYQGVLELNGDLTFKGSGSSTFLGLVTGSGGLEVQTGHTLSLRARNDFAGGLTIAGGEVRMEAGSQGSGDIVLDAGKLTTFGAAELLNEVIIRPDGGLFDNFSVLTLGGRLSGSGRLTKAGGGELFLKEGGDFTGDILIIQGALRTGSDALSMSTKVTIRGGATFIAAGTAVGSVNVAGTLQLEGRVAVAGAADDIVSGAITGAGSLLKTGGGKLTLSHSNTFLGGLKIADGSTLLVTADGAAGAGTLTLDQSTLATEAGKNVSLSNAVAFIDAITIDALGDSNLMLSGAVSGSATIVKEGAGTLILSGANTYAGELRITDGVVAARAATALGTASIELSAMLDLQGGIAIGNDIKVEGEGVLGSAGSTNTINGQISGSGHLIIRAPNNLEIAGDSVHTGATTIEVGILVSRNGDAIGDTSALTIDTSGRLFLHRDETVGSLAGGGMVQFLTASDLTVGGDDSSTTFSGQLIEPSGRLIKIGTGVLTLTGDNAGTSAYGAPEDAGASGTVIEGGTVRIGAGGAFGMIRGNVLNNARLVFDRSDDVRFGALGVTESGVISGTGSLTKAGAGALRLEGDNTFTGPTVVQAGTLSIGGKHASSITVASGATLTGDGKISGAVSVQGGGFLAVEYGAGALEIGDLSLGDGSLSFGLGGTGTTAARRLDVTGSVSLDGGILRHFVLSGFAASPDQTILLIDNDGTDAVNGTFEGLAEGAVVEIDETDFRISYRGGDGNDITLRSAAAPAPEPEQGPETGPEPQPEFTAPQIRELFAAAAGFASNSPKAQASNITLADGTVAPNPAFEAAMRLARLIAQFEAGIIDRDGLIEGVTDISAPTSGVALQAYQFFTGRTPTMSGMGWLIDSASNANDLTDPYYARFNEVNRFINFAVNLGVQGEGRAAFEAKFGALDFAAAVRLAYDMVIGLDDARAAGIDVGAALAWIASQEGYFDAFAGSDLGGKAAMIGYIMQAGLEGRVGRYHEATRDFINSSFEGAPAYHVDLVGGQHLGG